MIHATPVYDIAYMSMYVTLKSGIPLPNLPGTFLMLVTMKKANVGTDKFESDIQVIISAMVVSDMSLLV